MEVVVSPGGVRRSEHALPCCGTEEAAGGLWLQHMSSMGCSALHPHSQLQHP
jgi:hypothetical protein